MNFGLVIIWMAVIFWFSGQNAEESSRQSGVVLNTLHEHGATWLTMHEVRKLAHFSAYMVLGGLMYNAVRGVVVQRVVLWSVALCAVYATSDEIHQLFITGRSSELRDVIIDTVGAALGVYIVRRVLKHFADRTRRG